MNAIRRAVIGLVLVAALSALVGVALLGRVRWFVEYPFPVTEAHRLFDIGLVDANGDGHLDVFTSNHHFRQSLLIADGKGGFRDVLTEWGLDQSRAFPMAEIAFEPPPVDVPGIYVYWLGTDLVIHAHQPSDASAWRGTLQVYDPVTVKKQDGVEATKQEEKIGAVTRTFLEFGANGSGKLVLTPGGQGLPVEFDFHRGIGAERIFVGRGKVSPAATRFSLALQDRHALAWSDYNDDGTLDLFVNRGGLGGSLRAYPEEVVRDVRDELFLSRGAGKFEEAGMATGLRKNGCSGRHARWVDVNGDGFLDLFVNCYDRENVAGDFPKQLYRQDASKALRDVAEETGLGLPEEQMGNLVWFDVESDGDVDLLAFQDEGVFLYRNDSGRFSQELVFRRPTTEGEKVGRTTESAWLFDGKLVVADYDGDGQLDLFSSSKRGNLLLRNRGGLFDAIDAKDAGLPERSMTANWVDFDSDGRVDLHLVPQGLYRQIEGHLFEATGLLEHDPEQYRAAICNWFDLDDDGRLDVLMALDENPSFAGRWDFFKRDRPKPKWRLLAYRNVGAEQHWLHVDLAGGAGNRQAIGARVTLQTPGGRQTQEVGTSDGSFFSQGHYRLYFGLGRHSRAESLSILWSDGSHRELRDVEADQSITVGPDSLRGTALPALQTSQTHSSADGNVGAIR